MLRTRIKEFLFGKCCRTCDTKKDIISICGDCLNKIKQKNLNHGYDIGLKEGEKKALAKRGVNLSPQTVKRLIMLCHPDKHGNSAESNEVTKWLLKQRGEKWWTI